MPPQEPTMFEDESRGDVAPGRRYGVGDFMVDELSLDCVNRNVKSGSRNITSSEVPNLTNMNGTGKWPRLKLNPSVMALRNPIREITESMSSPNSDKRVISLAVGDPSSSGLVSAPEVATDALVKSVLDGTRNGYTNSCGADDCRQAIAKSADVTVEDVFVCQGCSQGLMHSIAALAAPHANILLPKPGFPLYQVLAEYYGVEVRYYNLKPESNWEADIDMIHSLYDENTCALMVCNPSNPCGAVFSRDHLQQILATAAHLQLPIISDEVYAGISWGPSPFLSMAEVARNDRNRVPIIEVGAISKRFVVPGWRLGWMILHDHNSIFKDSGLYSALIKLQQVTLSANSLVQATLPSLLEDCPMEYHEKLNDALEKAANFCYERCNEIPGLKAASRPYGAMYLMMKINCVEFDDCINSDRDFADMLVREESVKVLPGQCFGIPEYVRIVFAAPHDDLDEAWNRIDQFCRRHLRSQ